MDVTCFMVRIIYASVIEEVFSIQINSKKFRIKIMEEAQGPIGLLARRNADKNSGSEEKVVGSVDNFDRWEDE